MNQPFSTVAVYANLFFFFLVGEGVNVSHILYKQLPYEHNGKWQLSCFFIQCQPVGLANRAAEYSALFLLPPKDLI